MKTTDILKTVFLMLAGITAMPLIASQITVASYNIRVLTADDTGATNWSVRKPYVARTVIDNGFDIVGFNEVKYQTQREQLEELLPEYTFCGWDGEAGFEAGNNPALDLVAFRSDMFDMLDSGWYFLCRNSETWASDWDNSSYANARVTSWAKLQVKGTDEILYFFCTHLDHVGNVARMLQSHINYDRMWQIAGHYPTVMVGDQNSSTSRVNYLRLYQAGFTDAFSVVENPTERFGSDDPATSGQWNDDPTTGRRIDYIWARGFNVDSYDHCTNKYDLGVMPSDHVAIMAKLTYIDPDIDNRRLYVSAGADGNGSATAPFGNLQSAIDAARVGDTIYVAAGRYDISKSIEISKSVHLFGGYDNAFENVVGLSEVNGGSALRCIDIKSLTDVEMRNFAVRNGAVGSTADGAGIRAHGSRLILRECELSDNVAGRDGAGIDCNGQLILDHVRFLRNIAGANGGGFCCDNPNKRYWFNMTVKNCYFEGNEAADGAAGYLPRFVYAYVSYCTFSQNKALDGSTLYLQALGTDNNLGANLAVFNNTFTLNSASGENHASAIYVNIEPDGPFALANNTIVSNKSDSNVPAVYMQQGTPSVANNIIACNDGGDVFLNASSISAAYNLYTCSGSINYQFNTRDIYTDDAAAAAEGLAAVLDGNISDGRFVPELSLPDGASYFDVPSVAVINPAHAVGKVLNCVTALRLREDVLHGDFNFDCMQERGVMLPDDQAGVARPTNGTATMGAREYVEGAGVGTITSDTYINNAPVEYFDLQGRRVVNPTNGLYIRRQGAAVDKVIIR